MRYCVVCGLPVGRNDCKVLRQVYGKDYCHDACSDEGQPALVRTRAPTPIPLWQKWWESRNVLALVKYLGACIQVGELSPTKPISEEGGAWRRWRESALVDLHAPVPTEDQISMADAHRLTGRDRQTIRTLSQI